MTRAVHDRLVPGSQRERIAVLVIRVWVEGGESRGLRARITRTLDVDQRGQVSTAAATREQIEETVSSWLESFLALTGASPPTKN